MGLTIPIPSITEGPLYAAQIGLNLQIISAHDHSDSAKVTPAGLDITTDLSFNSNNAFALRTTRFVDQTSTLSGINDFNSCYFYLGDFYINSGSGVPVQITSGASPIGAGGGSGNIWEPLSISANHTVLAGDTVININVTTSSPITITLPSAASVSAGRYYVICDVSGASVTNNIALAPNGSNQINGSASVHYLTSAYGTWFLRSDGVSKWQLVYTGFSGLTSSSLTFGSTILNSTGLSVGSNTLTSTALTIGSGSMTTTGQLTVSQIFTNIATVTDTFYSNSLALLHNVVVAGNLSVSGTVSFNAGTVGVSSITEGTITNCTITGGSVGSTIATLSSGQLTAAQRAGWVVDVGYTYLALSGPTATSDEGTAYLGASAPRDLSNPGAITLTCNVGDILSIDYLVKTLSSSSGSRNIRCVVVDGSTQHVAGSWTRNTNTSQSTDHSFNGTYVIVSGGTITVKLQLLAVTGLTVCGGSSFRVTQYRP